MMAALAFYLFAGVAVASSVMVISARNSVHSALFLILAFFNAAGLFLLQGAEFLAMILVIVYVGAVAVLFLFVVMMLDIDFARLRQGFQQYLPMGGFIGLILLAELAAMGAGWVLAPQAAERIAAPAPESISNTEALGSLIYTHYIYLFQAAGLILLAAMVGAIVLTSRRREGVLKQDISVQVNRRAESSARTVKVKPGRGI